MQYKILYMTVRLSAVVFFTLILFSFSFDFISNDPFIDPPGRDSVKLFSPGIISDGLPNRDMAISPQMDEICYTVQQRGGGISCIMCMKLKNGKWSLPEVAGFSGMYNDLEPAFSPDGQHIYFSSKRIVGDTLSRNYDIYKADRVGNGWKNIQRLPFPVNTSKDEFYPSVASNGNLYFTRDVGEMKEDILIAKNNGNGYENPVSLPAEINSAGFEFNAFVDPMEQYILFTGFRRKDDRGGGDLYISRKDRNGQWTAAENLGDKINSATLDYCPFVSPDKKYLFFTSSRNLNRQPFNKTKSKDEIQKMLSSAGNGFDDIYWIKWDF